MSDISTKPYLIRAIYEWCADATFTPYLNVKVDQHVRVPMEYVKNGEIVLSIAQQATRNLTIGNDVIQFSARFNGVSREISIPVYAVQAIFARENGRGVFFEPETPPEEFTNTAHVAPVHATPLLQSVPTTAAATPVAAPATVAFTQVVEPKASNTAHPDDDAALANVTSTANSVADDPTKPKGPPRGNLRVVK